MSCKDVGSNSNFADMDLVSLYERRVRLAESDYCRQKLWLDRILAAILLIPGLPLMGLLCILVRLTSPGKAIYRQVRVGRHGKTFTMYKIRTMRSDAEKRTGAVWTQSNDPRITVIGWLLRKVHLDELPQLINVIKGEMSLVGPRPERPEFVIVLMDEIPGYLDRLAVLPGVTGLSQINLPPDTDLNSVRRKQYLDLEYIKTAGIWLDLRMMFCTSLRLVGLSGVLATRIAGVQRSVPGEYFSESLNIGLTRVRALGAQVAQPMTPEKLSADTPAEAPAQLQEAPAHANIMNSITVDVPIADRHASWSTRVLQPGHPR